MGYYNHGDKDLPINFKYPEREITTISTTICLYVDLKQSHVSFKIYELNYNMATFGYF